MTNSEIIKWLLEGDVSVRYQVYRDLLSDDNKNIQQKIASEGWGAKFLSLRNAKGHWGRGFYQPKWISSHYTLLDLRNLSIPTGIKSIDETIELIIKHSKSNDGGVNPSTANRNSDVCVCGMFLNYASYFGARQEGLKSVVDFILTQQMADGGFNCNLNQKGAVHGSLHSTLSVAEGISEYLKQGYTYRRDELEKAVGWAQEFMLMHRFFLSDRTGQIINRSFLAFPYPSRWKYDIMRALDYFRSAGYPCDERMSAAIEVINKKRRKDHRWNQYSKYPGLIHFEMEEAGLPGRWNTLRAMRILMHFKAEK